MNDSTPNFEEISAMNDQDFLKELRRVHNNFVIHVRNIMHQGRCQKHLFDSIAESIAINHDYVLLCGRIWVPIQFHNRLLKLLNEHQEKFKQFEEAPEVLTTEQR